MEKFSRYVGGAESYAVALASTLIENNWEVHLYGESWDGEPAQAFFHKIYIPKFLPAWLKLLLFALKHKAMTKNENYDVVVGFGNTIFMNFYQSHGGVHQLSTARKVYAEKSSLARFIKRIIIIFSIKHWTRAWIEAAPFRLEPKPKIIAIADMIKNDMVSFFRVNPRAIEIIYNGVDTKRFNGEIRRRMRGTLRARWGVGDNDVVFLFVSYDLKKKGIEPLIEAAAKLKQAGRNNFKVIIAGGLPYPSLAKRIKQLDVNDKIIFSGRVKDIDEFYANSDVFVLPTYYDACSLVVIEAMASGLPAITTTYNGAAGIITDGRDGYVIKHPPDAHELSDKMNFLMDNEQLEKMLKEASLTGRQYSAEKNHKKMMKALEEAASVKE